MKNKKFISSSNKSRLEIEMNDLNSKKPNDQSNGEEFKLIKLEKTDLSSRTFFVLKTANLESLLLAYKECKL